MNDLIERDKAIAKAFCTTVDGVPRMVVLLNDIKAIPSADAPTTMTGVIDAIHEAEYRGYMKAVEDRPQGEWIDAEIPLECGGSMPIQVCNLCKTFYPLAYTGGGHRFCPNCGAKMKGADDA